MRRERDTALRLSLAYWHASGRAWLLGRFLLIDTVAIIAATADRPFRYVLTPTLAQEATANTFESLIAYHPVDVPFDYVVVTRVHPEWTFPADLYIWDN